MKRKLPHTRACFVCGLLNPAGLRLDFEADTDCVTARYVPKPEHVGFQNTIHGGIVSTVLDEIMVWAIGTQCHRFAYCAELTVRFNLPVRPGAELTAWAGPVTNRKNRLYETVGELRDAQGNVLASATGKYIPIKDTDQALLMADFVEDTSTIFGRTTIQSPSDAQVP